MSDQTPKDYLLSSANDSEKSETMDSSWMLKKMRTRSVKEILEEKMNYLRKVEQTEKEIQSISYKREIIQNDIREKQKEAIENNLRLEQIRDQKNREEVFRGRALFRQESYEESLSVWQKLLVENPQDEIASEYYKLCEDRIMARESEAKNLIELEKCRVLENEQKLKKAKILFGNGDLVGAKQYLEAELLQPNSNKLLQNFYEEVLEKVRKASNKDKEEEEIENARSQRETFLKKQSLELINSSCWEQAEEYLQELVEGFKVEDEWFERLALVQSSLVKEKRRYQDEEKKAYRELKKLELEFYSAFENQNWEGAEKLLHKVISLSPEDKHKEWKAYLKTVINNKVTLIKENEEKQKHKILAEKKQKEEQEEDFRECLEEIYELKANGKNQEAFHLMKRCSSQYADLPNFELEISSLESSLKQFEKDKEQKLKLERDKRNTNENLFLSSMKLFSEGKYEEAQDVVSQIEVNAITDLDKKILKLKNSIQDKVKVQKGTIEVEKESELSKCIFHIREAISNKNPILAMEWLDKALTLNIDSEEQRKKIEIFEEQIRNLEIELNEEENQSKEDFAQYFEEGLRAYENGHFFKAVMALKRCLEIKKEDGEIRYFYNLAYEALVKEEESLKEKRLKKQKFSREYALVHSKVIHLVRGNEFQEALNHLDELLTLFPGEEKIIADIQDVQRLWDNYKESERELNRSFEKEKRVKGFIDKISAALNKEKYDDALLLVRQALIVDSKAQGLLDLKKDIIEEKKAYQQLQEEKQEKLRQKKKIEEEEQRELQEKKEKELLAFLDKGRDLQSKGHLEEALNEYQKARIVFPQNEIIEGEINKISRRIKEEEIKTYQEKELSQERQQKIREVWQKGRMLLRTGLLVESLEALEEGVLLYGEDSLLFNEIQKVEEVLIRDNRQELQLEEDNRKLEELIFWGNREYNRGDFEKSIEYFEEAIEIDPSNLELKKALLAADSELRAQQSFHDAGELDLETIHPGGNELVSVEPIHSDSRQKLTRAEVSEYYILAKNAQAEGNTEDAVRFLEKGLEMADRDGIKSFTVSRMRSIYKKIIENEEKRGL